MSIQEVKEYWNNRPCNIKHSNKEIGTKEYFKEITARKYKVESHILEFADFKKWKGKKIFNRMIPWILLILFFEIITVALRLQDATVLQLNNSIFISKKIHQLVSCWSMALMLLFIGFYHTFK